MQRILFTVCLAFGLSMAQTSDYCAITKQHTMCQFQVNSANIYEAMGKSRNENECV